jgi:alkanesulfonate monooxygenase SsuD/methylene tetrahydromethanopterin reductase-like flavin-dependent oxidoreductase (luciferase family)
MSTVKDQPTKAQGGSGTNGDRRLRLATITLWANDLDAFREDVRAIESFGYDVLTVGDAPFAFHDMYVSLTIAATETTRVMLGTMVGTPFLRHPVSDAGAMASLSDFSGGRAVFTLGSGGGVPQGIGVIPATAEHTGAYLKAMRDLLAGRETTWEGRPVSAMRQVRAVPLLMSAYGPKAQRVAGQVADGAVLAIGSSETQLAALREGVATVREGAADAGRNPDDVEIWVNSHFSVADTWDDAVAPLKDFLATTAAFRLRPKHRMARVPEEFHEAIFELRRRYSMKDHALAGGVNGALVDELGLARVLSGESTVCGTPEEVGKVLDQLEELGVSCVNCSVSGTANPQQALQRFAELVRSRG